MASASVASANAMSIEDLAKGAKATADLAGLEFALDTSFLSRDALLQAIQAATAPSPLLAIKKEFVKIEDTQQLPPMLAPAVLPPGMSGTEELEQPSSQPMFPVLHVDDSQVSSGQAAPPEPAPQNSVHATPSPVLQLQAKVKQLENQLAVRESAADTAEDDHEEPDEGGEEAGKVMVTSPDGTIVLTQDALRMRLKRMCEKKSKSQKCHVDDETHQQYVSAGPEREWLELALLEALQAVGPDALGRGKAAHKLASFKVQVTQIRERQHLKESESNGEWLTEERMVKSGEYSKQTIKSIIDYCLRFPQILTRKWKYNVEVLEYFVETSTKQTIKHSELLRRVETMDCGEKAPGDMPTDTDAPPAIVDEAGAQPRQEQVGDK
ncbi:unnamed protein product, partial [Symbiodinium sp. CCMP2456]